SAADAWLGESHARLAGQLDEAWRVATEADWRAHYTQVREKEERIDALEAKASAGPLEEPEAWEQAWLVEERRGTESALPVYVAYAERFPDIARARFHAGRVLLETGDAAGIEHLEVSMEQADDAIVPGCDQIATFLDEHGDSAAAAHYRDRRDAHQKELDAIEEERTVLPLDIEYQHHGADAEDIAELTEDLQKLDEVKAAWLTRRPLELSEDPLYVLAVLRRRFTWNPRTWNEYQKDPKKDDLALQARIAEAVRVPGQTKILVLNHRGKVAREAWTTVPGSQILG
ncbi:MAG: hypothetical protein ACYTDY_20210, partial [Planctomycetota bacterium]